MSTWYEADELNALDNIILDALEAEAMVDADDTDFELGTGYVTLRATWEVSDNGE